MKKLIFSLSLFLMAFVANAQSEMYTNGMNGMLAKLKAAKSSESYLDVANGFKRISEAEPQSQWLPKYYAAYSLILQAMSSTEKTQVDAILDEADRMLSQLTNTNANDEILVLKAFSKSTRISVDPMSRGMKFGAQSAKLLESAKAINEKNPRIYFLQGQSAFYTPEQFGGGKKVAQPLYMKAIELFDKSAPAQPFMPSWGKEVAIQMLGQCN